MARNISEFTNDMGYVTSSNLDQTYVKKAADDILNANYIVNGDITVNGAVNANVFGGLSDIAKKSNLSEIEFGLDRLYNVTGYTYNLEGCQTRKAGLIAQQVETALPEAVTTDNDGNKRVDYNGVVALLLQSIKQLHKEVETLKQEVDRLTAGNIIR